MKKAAETGAAPSATTDASNEKLPRLYHGTICGDKPCQGPSASSCLAGAEKDVPTLLPEELDNLKNQRRGAIR